MNVSNRLCLFEFDERFKKECEENEFCFYDCDNPTDIPKRYCHQFDFVMGDPPRLFGHTLFLTLFVIPLSYIFNLISYRNERTTTSFLKSMHLLQRYTDDPSVIPLSAVSAESPQIDHCQQESPPPSTDSDVNKTPLLLVTSATLRDFIRVEHHLTPCDFKPTHAQLMNEMLAYTSYRSTILGVEDEVPASLE